MRRPILQFLFFISVFSLFITTGCVEPTDEVVDTRTCGNGTIDPGEQCDDGNTMSHDGCSETCTIESFCGNGIVEPGEECDDGNIDNDDGCSRECQVETGCGNGILEIGEECDDGNVDSDDGCDGDCLMENPTAVCGNGIHEYTEGCDDGNTEDGDGCSSTCRQEAGCGNGTLDPGEQCDDGNAIDGDGCSHWCQVEFSCGDNVCRTDQGETCELCPNDCCPSCGNGVLDEGEECDDGNNTSGDGCSRGCTDEDNTAVCGNGLWEAGEECDDGNNVAHDGCSPLCIKEYTCGDGVCSSTEGENCQNCIVDCCPACGNGIRQIGEECDTNELNDRTCEDFGYSGGNLACTSWCSFDYSGCTGSGPVCGNDVTEYGEQCDGSDMQGVTCQSLGYMAGIAFCGANCTYNTTGCSNQVRWFFEDFETVLVPAGWDFSYPFEWGTPTTVGPSSTFSGSSCVGTSLSSYAPEDAAYDTTWVRTPAIDLSQAVTPTLYFWAWAEIEDSTSYDDEFKVEYSLDGTTWSALTTTDPAYTNETSTAWRWYEGIQAWNPYLVDVSAAAGMSQVYFRFSAQFDHYADLAGVYIDDVMVVEAAHIPVTITTPNELGMSLTGFNFDRAIQVWGGSGDFTYSFVGTSPSWLSIDSTVGALSGTPTLADVGAESITIRVMDNVNPLNYAEKTFTFDVLAPFDYSGYSESFDSGSLPTGWEIVGNVWEYGTPTATDGPASCSSGTGCMGTGMSGDYPNSMGWFDHCVYSPYFDMSAATAPVLQFKGWRYTETNYDGAICEVETNNSGTWEDSSTHTPEYNEENGSRMTWSGQQQTWEDFSVDLAPYAGDLVRVRWCFYSDGSGTYPGFYIDDVSILEGYDIPIVFETPASLGSAIVGFPFAHSLEVTGGSGSFTFSFVGASPSWLSIDSATGALSGTPTLPDVGSESITIRVMDNLNPMNYTDSTFTIDVLAPVDYSGYSENFDSGSLPAGWEIVGNVWEYGTATSAGGPSSCNSGTGCLGTNTTDDYISGMAWFDHCVYSPYIDMSAATAPVLQFKGWRYTETSYDGAICEVEMNGSGTWDDSSTHTPAYNEENGGRDTWSGQQQTWEDFSVDMTPYVGNVVRVRWCFYSDSSVTYPGWFVDDVRLLGN